MPQWNKSTHSKFIMVIACKLIFVLLNEKVNRDCTSIWIVHDENQMKFDVLDAE
jgi:hypothetical protein